MYKIYLDGVLIHDSTSLDPTQKVINPQLKLEINKSGALSFAMVPNHPMFWKAKPLSSMVSVTMEDETIYRGRVLSVDTDISMQKQVQCEGDFSFFVDTVCAKGERTETVANHFRWIISQHNAMADNNKKFTVGTINIKDANKSETWDNSNYSDAQKVLKNDLLDVYGGYIRFRYVGSTTYIDYLKDFGVESSQPLAFGENMLSLGQTESGEDIFTVLLPTGDNDLTIADANGGSIYLTNQAGVQKYGKIVQIQDFPGYDTAASLKSAAQTYFNENYHDIPPQFTIKALDLHLLDGSVAPFGLGYKYPVKSEVHGIDTKVACTSIQYDLANPENTSLELGDIQLLNPHNAKSKKSSSKGRRGGGGGGGGGGGTGGESGTGMTKISVDMIDWETDKIDFVDKQGKQTKEDFIKFKNIVLEKLKFDEGIGGELTITGNFRSTGNFTCTGGATFGQDITIGGMYPVCSPDKTIIRGMVSKTLVVCTELPTITMPSISLSNQNYFMASAAGSTTASQWYYGSVVRSYSNGTVGAGKFKQITFLGTVAED